MESLKTLILASGSPRRKELLQQADIPFSIVVSKIEEIVDNSLPPEEIVKSLAYQKAADVAKDYADHVVLGADTIVVYETTILGKPTSKEDAFRMLKLLSGNTHYVMTGVALVCNDDVHTFAVTTKVTFWELTDDEIWSYIETNEPMDKAGSYGIQGKGCVLVKEIEGDYFSVVGLPISKVNQALKRFHN
ncbi:MAG: Maf family protein [Bacillaceae bacterium]